jgi:hypothetical protein
MDSVSVNVSTNKMTTCVTLNKKNKKILKIYIYKTKYIYIYLFILVLLMYIFNNFFKSDMCHHFTGTDVTPNGIC